jgi:two-component system KDP operon response regulator KdpE
VGNKYKILVIEDEANIRSFMETILETNGYQVLTACSSGQGMLMFSSHCPDLIILDLGLPDQDGMEYIRAVRKTSGVPVIVVSARSDEKDKVAALDLGANDYVTKPFGTAELLARVRAALRAQWNSRGGTGPGAVPDGRFSVKDMVIDYGRRKVYIGSQEIHLTQTEYNIVTLLSEYPGKVLTYAAIIRGIWGDADPGSVKKLQVNMANIRKKLGSRPGHNQYILNELGVGYRMYAPDDHQSREHAEKGESVPDREDRTVSAGSGRDERTER